MEIKLLTETEKAHYGEQIFALLREADADFVPPLSARFPEAKNEADGVRRYFDEMLTANLLATLEGDTLLGFVAFRENISGNYIPEGTFPNLYIGTAVITREARGMHLTTRMYEYLFDVLRPDYSCFTRTWSTNAAHIAILTRMGFSLTKRVENDRAEGIDSVYFGLIRK